MWARVGAGSRFRANVVDSLPGEFFGQCPTFTPKTSENLARSVIKLLKAKSFHPKRHHPLPQHRKGIDRPQMTIFKSNPVQDSSIKPFMRLLKSNLFEMSLCMRMRVPSITTVATNMLECEYMKMINFPFRRCTTKKNVGKILLERKLSNNMNAGHICERIPVG